MFNTIIFLFVLFVISLATHLIIRNKLNIEKQYIYESVNKIDKYGSILIVVVSLIIYTWLVVLQFKANGNVAIVANLFPSFGRDGSKSVPNLYAVEIQQRS